MITYLLKGPSIYDYIPEFSWVSPGAMTMVDSFDGKGVILILTDDHIQGLYELSFGKNPWNEKIALGWKALEVEEDKLSLAPRNRPLALTIPYVEKYQKIHSLITTISNKSEFGTFQKTLEYRSPYSLAIWHHYTYLQIGRPKKFMKYSYTYTLQEF